MAKKAKAKSKTPHADVMEATKAQFKGRKRGKFKPINLNNWAKEITTEEGGAISTDIGQVKEVMRLIFVKMSRELETVNGTVRVIEAIGRF